MSNKDTNKDQVPEILSEVEKLLVAESKPGLVAAWDKLKPFFTENLDEFLLISTHKDSNLIDPMDVMKIYEITEPLRTNLELDEDLNRIVKILHTNLGYRMVMISLLNHETGEFERRAQRGLPEKVFEQISQQRIPQSQFNKMLESRFKISRSYFIPEGESASLNKYSYISAKVREVEGEDGWHKEDMLIIPLYSREEEIIGFLSVDDPVDSKRPSHRDIVMLEIFAGQVVKVIENALVYENTRKELSRFSALFRISTLFTSTMDLDKAMQSVVEIIKDQMGFLWVALFCKDNTTDTLYIKTQTGLDDSRCRGLKLDIGNEGGLVGSAAASGQVRVSNDLNTYPKDYIKMFDETRSELAVPIKTKRALVGILYAEHCQTKVFTQSSIQFHRLVANRLGMACENAEIMEELEKDLTLHTSIYDLGNIVNSILNLDRLLRKSIELMQKSFEYWRISIFLFNEDHTKLVLRAVAGDDSEEWEPLEIEVGKEGISGIVASTGKFLNIGDVRNFPLFIRGAQKTLSEVVVPLKRYNEILGVLDIESPRLHAFSDFDVKVAHLFSNQISVAIVNAKLYERERELAIRDGLTGLFNYRYFKNQFRKEYNRASRFNRCFTYLMVDIDGFKGYNDTYGHTAGDEVLRKLGDILVKCSRENIDTVSRYGGEEFVIILPEVNKEEGIRMAEHLRNSVEEYNFTPSGTQNAKPLTISIGVATYPDDGENQAQIIKKADEALYKAKNEGKNRVRSS